MRFSLFVPVMLVLPSAGAGRDEPAAQCWAAARPDRAPKANARLNMVQSDSLWLKRRLERDLPDRLAAFHVDTGADGRPRVVVRLTGHAPVAPMRLAGRVRDVPVTISYGAPHSLRTVDEIRGSASVRDGLGALLPGVQGEAYDAPRGVIQLFLFAPDGAAQRRAMARCDALRALYGMPVEIELVPAATDLQLPRRLAAPG